MGPQTGWDCETCRRNGLQHKRRCAFLDVPQADPPGLVWARGPVITNRCPRSEISAQSHAWIQLYAAWKRLGSGDLWRLAAKDAEALMFLEEEWQKERSND